MRVNGMIKDLVQLFDALSDDRRLRVLNLLLLGEELCICDITDVLKLSQFEAMSHLEYLKKAGLIHFKVDEFWAYGILLDIYPGLHNLVLRHLRDIFKGEVVFVADRKRLEERLLVLGRCERAAVA